MTVEAMRWSTDGCTIAAALDVVGDRQTFLVMREVVTGVRRFADIQKLTCMPRQSQFGAVHLKLESLHAMPAAVAELTKP